MTTIMVLSSRCLMLLFWIFALEGVSAQGLQFQFQQLGQKEGLDNNTSNYFISEDTRGFIWIGSLNGFYRYDGVRLKHFLIPVNKADAFVTDQLIQSGFWEDQNGNLWFTTYNSLHCFNRQNSTITNFQAPTIKGQKAGHFYHIFHKEVNSDRLWLRAGDHVWVYDIVNNRWEAKFPSQGIRYCVGTNPLGTITTVISCAWLKGPLTVNRKEANGNWVSTNYLDPNLEIRAAILKTDSTAWLFSNKGLLEFNFISSSLQSSFTHTAEQMELNLFDGVFIQNNRFLLLATHSNGVLAFDTRKKVVVQQWKKENETNSSILSNSPRAFFLSKSQQLWVGHKQGGVDFSKCSQEVFRNPLILDIGLSSKIANLLEDKQRNIWVLTNEGNLYRSAGGSAPLKPVPGPDVHTSLSFLAVDDFNTIWAISNGAIYRLKENSASGKTKWELILYSNLGLVSIYLGVPGRILLITKSGVFDLLNNDGKYRLRRISEFKAYPDFSFYHFYKINDTITLIPFKSNELWIARVEQQNLVISKKLELGGDTFCACTSPSGDSIWLGTRTGLVLYYKGKAKQMLKSAEDLNGASLFGLIKTGSNHLWISTSHGLLKYQTKTNQLTSFFQKDGLSNDQFTPYAYLKASDGRLWLGNEQGLTVFHPDSVRENMPKPRVYIEAFWVNNLPFETQKNINETDTLQLGYLENTLAFELKAVSFHQAESNSLAYRLLGYDDSWARVPNGGYARFTNVPPGHYNLEILPLNANGQSGPMHVLSIDIRPPFWQTLWFKIISVLFALLFVITIVGLYYRRKLREQRALLERQQALSDERNRIAKELHDDMGSSLSSIIFLSEDLLMEDTPSKKQEINRIFSLAEHSLENMQEIIWAMDTGKNTLQDLSIRLRALATELLTDNKVPFELDFPLTSLDEYVLGGESRRNTYLIIKEALHNTIKHAKASMVKVSLKLDGPFVVLEIQDNGLGFDEHLSTATGHGIINMRERAKAIRGTLLVSSSSGEGTLLRLRVPL